MHDPRSPSPVSRDERGALVANIGGVPVPSSDVVAFALRIDNAIRDALRNVAVPSRFSHAMRSMHGWSNAVACDLARVSVASPGAPVLTDADRLALYDLAVALSSRQSLANAAIRDLRMEAARIAAIPSTDPLTPSERAGRMDDGTPSILPSRVRPTSAERRGFYQAIATAPARIAYGTGSASDLTPEEAVTLRTILRNGTPYLCGSAPDGITFADASEWRRMARATIARALDAAGIAPDVAMGVRLANAERAINMALRPSTAAPRVTTWDLTRADWHDRLEAHDLRERAKVASLEHAATTCADVLTHAVAALTDVRTWLDAALDGWKPAAPVAPTPEPSVTPEPTTVEALAAAQAADRAATDAATVDNAEIALRVKRRGKRAANAADADANGDG